MGLIPHMRRWLTALLALALIAGMSAGALAQGRGHGPKQEGWGRHEAHQRFTEVTGFTDLDETDSWAIPYITQLYLQGLVKGQGNGRFNPKASISQAEAVTLVVRAEKGDDEKALNAAARIAGSMDPRDMKDWLDRNTDWNVRSIEHSARWSLPYLVVAVHDGLVDGHASFNPNEAAHRIWATELLVKGEIAMGILDESDVAGADLGILARFTDVAGLSVEDGRYLAAAITAGLADGYPDHTFRPNASISRAEFTTLVARAVSGEHGAPQVVSGTVTAVTRTSGASSITIETDTNGDEAGGVAQATYEVLPDALIYVKVGGHFVSGSGETLTLDSVQVGDRVTLHLDEDGKVALIYDQFEVQEISGTVTSVTAPTNASDPYEIDLRTVSGSTYATRHFAIAPYATIYLRGQESSMAVVREGVEATVQYHGGEAVSVRVTGEAQGGGTGGGSGDIGELNGEVTLTGTVRSITGENSFTFTVTTVDNGTVNVSVVYSVTTDADTNFEHVSGVAGLDEGDTVTVSGMGDGYGIDAARVTLDTAN